MYKFSKRSLANLATADETLQRLFNEVIKKVDCIVICGHRSTEEQFKLFQQGREKKNGRWIKVGPTVTNIDGNVKKSNHNYLPSRAVDVIPYPVDWNDIDKFKQLGKIVKETAKELNIEISWGGDWQSFKDYPHYEIISKGA